MLPVQDVISHPEVSVSAVRHVAFGEVINARGVEQQQGTGYRVLSSSLVMPHVSIARPYRLDFYIVCLLRKGQINLRYNLRDYSILGPALFLMVPKGIYEFFHLSQDCSFTLLSFSSHFVNASGIPKKHLEAFRLFAAKATHVSLNENELDTFDSLFSLLYKNSRLDDKEQFQRPRTYHAFNLFLYETAALFKERTLLSTSQLSRKEELAMRFINLLNTHCKRDRKVQFYADQLFVTKRHLTRCLKEVMGKTCDEMIDEMVIIEAKLLLDNTSLTLAQIADQLHFSDQFSFSKYFKKHAGQAPREYRMALT